MLKLTPFSLHFHFCLEREEGRKEEIEETDGETARRWRINKYRVALLMMLDRFP